MKICDLCQQVADRLHSGLKGAPIEVCDACNNDLMASITKLQREEARMRARLWTDMIEQWKTERSAPTG
jgi:hypothetical protein